MSAFVLAALLSLLPCSRAMAQWTFDVLGTEAYIDDHKRMRTVLLARSTLEWGNEVLHGIASDSVMSYRDVNAALDEYMRAFDVLDVIYNSLRTVVNVKDTYTNVKDVLEKYADVLDEYNDKVISSGRADVRDTVIVTLAVAAVENIADDVEDLYGSCSTLWLYATGIGGCSAAAMTDVIDAVNASLDRIESHLYAAYYSTWKWIRMRTGYWKESVYLAKTREEIASEALSRWKGNWDE